MKRGGELKEVEFLCVLCLAAMAVILDLWKRKIPNVLTFAGVAVGGIFQSINYGYMGILLFLGGVGTPLLVLGALYYFRMIGAGDIKLFCALGGFLGAIKSLTCILIAFLVGAGISVILILWRRNLWSRLGYFYAYISNYFHLKKWEPYRRDEDVDSHMYFSVPILISVILYVGGFY